MGEKMGAIKVFSETRMFSYNRRMKIAFGVAVIFSAILIASSILSYFLVLNKIDSRAVEIFQSVTGHVMSHISSSTILGIIYISLIGGLFFIFMPMEVFIARFITAGNPFFVVLLLYLGGVFISYNVNYFIGLKLSRLSKKLISPRKFYSIKGKLNRYGSWAIFVFNVPPLPSQILAAVLGVFRYNKTKFYVFFMAGQLVKCIAIWAGIHLFS